MFGLHVEDEPWREQAACRTLPDPDVMFPNLDRHTEVEEAKKVCARCPLTAGEKRECAVAALRTGDKYSVSGGMTPKERKRWAHAETA